MYVFISSEKENASCNTYNRIGKDNNVAYGTKMSESQPKFPKFWPLNMFFGGGIRNYLTKNCS